jgi:hypothetical protein
VFLHLSSKTCNQEEIKKKGPKKNLKDERTHVQTIFTKEHE